MARQQINGFQYEDLAVDRIRKMEAKFIREFFKELPLSAIAESVSHLPNPRGFRSNNQQGVHRKVFLLADRMVGDKRRISKNFQRDFDALGLAWIIWGVEHFGDTNLIDDYITRSQASGKGKIGEGNKDSKGDDPLVLELFEKLRDLSHSNKCGRADIKKFFEFSPFSETERLRGIIESCKPSSEVARDRKISVLPERVERIEQDVASLQATLDVISNGVNEQVRVISALRRDVENLQQAVTANRKKMSTVGRRMDMVQSKIESQREELEKNSTAQERAFQNLATSIEKLQNEVAEVSHQIAPLPKRSDLADQSIKSINEELDQAQKMLSEIWEIVNRTPVKESPTDTSSNSKETVKPVPCSVTLERLQVSDLRKEPPIFQCTDELIQAIATNLESLSIAKSSAKALALEFIAALLAGQIPYFAGLRNKQVAKACAMTLAAQDSHILTVPVGISSPNEFHRQFESLLDIKRSDIGCIIIDGINRSAFDAFGDCLIDVVSRQRSGDSGSQSLLVIATLMDGPASLPPSIAHVSLGPIFYTDALVWRTRYKKGPKNIFGRISAQKWQEAFEDVGKNTADTEDVLRLLEECIPVVNPLLRGTVLSGFRVLSALQNDSAVPTSLQSSVLGWLVPACVAIGATSETANHLVNQVNLEDGTPDTRLVNLLRLGILDDTQHKGI